MTAQELIKASLRLLGSHGAGKVPSNEEMSDALSTLNILLNQLAAKKLILQALVFENFNLVVGTNSYTVGVGAVFNTAKPIKIESAFIRDSNNFDTPIRILTATEYDLYSSKGSSGIPEGLYFDAGITQQVTQTGTIYLYPAPDLTYKLYIRSQKYFTNFSTISDNITFPPSYQEMLVYNLAIRLAPQYGVTLQPEVIAIANEAMKSVQNTNAIVEPAMLDFAITQPNGNIYNITGR